MLSFWEQESFIRYDAIVIGSGITGLSTAITVKQRHPERSVLVLERGLFPTGASTKNAGFACFGSLTEVLADIRTSGEANALAVVEKRWRGLAMLRRRLGDASIDYQQHGGYELLFDRDLHATEEIERVNDLLRPIFGGDVFTLRNDLIGEFGFNAGAVHSLVENPYEGQIDTGKMMRALMRRAVESGVEIITGATVDAVEEKGSGVEVTVEHRVLNERVRFIGRQVAICANGMTGQFLPELAVKPGRGQVLITDPIDGLPWKGVFHFDEGFYYFRNVRNRVLFGGGRNLAFEEERTNDFACNEVIMKRLENILREIILPDTPFTIDSRWTGVMGFNADKCPVVKKVSDRITVGFGCNGMGIAIGSLIGEETGEMMNSE
jgi:glycine/D-amino acid oxidase-like deaminating enzyme